MMGALVAVLFRVRSPAIHDLNDPKRDAEHTTPPVLAFLPLTYVHVALQSFSSAPSSPAERVIVCDPGENDQAVKLQVHLNKHRLRSV